MNDDHSNKVKELFSRSLELPPGELSAFLDAECGGDSVLRDRVDKLLGSHSTAGTFLADPEFLPNEDDSVDPDIATDKDGARRIGVFQI